MKFQNVVIRAQSYLLPDGAHSSEQVENELAPIYQGLNLPEGRLALMTGIHERRYWPVGTRPSTLASTVAQNLFQNNPEVRPENIDLLIHASVCRDFLEPASASVTHHNLGLRADCEFFDLSNACLGVMSAVTHAAKLIEAGVIKEALIVSAENAGPLFEATKNELFSKFEKGQLNRKNIKPYIANLTIGSAAVAFVISHRDLAPKASRLLGSTLMADTSAHTLCQGSGDTNHLMMETHSEELLQAGITLAKKTWSKLITDLELKPDELGFVIGHQVGVAHEKLTLEAMELNHHKTFITYDKLGNTGSAALPITYMKLCESERRPETGEKIALLGIGSGLSSLMCLVEKGEL